jgi:RNA polymerase sigma-70 factor (ECF subfamily)
MPLTEAEIKERLLARDADALDTLRREYESYCAAIVRGILLDPADVEEVVSDVWMQVWTSIPPNEPEHLRLYVGRIARNLALNRLEYHNAGKRAAPLQELAAVTPDRNLEHQALKDALERFLRQQKPLHRQLFLRRYWYGDSIEELSAHFGCSKAKATGILFRLRRNLREHLEKEDLYV